MTQALQHVDDRVCNMSPSAQHFMLLRISVSTQQPQISGAFYSSSRHDGQVRALVRPSSPGHGDESDVVRSLSLSPLLFLFLFLSLSLFLSSLLPGIEGELPSGHQARPPLSHSLSLSLYFSFQIGILQQGGLLLLHSVAVFRASGSRKLICCLWGCPEH